MATYVKYETFIENLFNKLIDGFGTTDTWRVIIHTDAPTVATDNNAKTDLSQIAGSNGYNTDGDNVTYNGTRSGATLTATANDNTWTASGGNLGASTTGRYFTLYDDTSTADNPAASWDYGATFTVASGETIVWDVTGSVFTAT